MEDQQKILLLREGGEDERGESTHLEEFLSSYDFRALKRGDILKGTVVRVSPAEILIDVGSKSEGIVSSREVERMDPEEIERLHVGDEVLVYVLKAEDKDGNIILSLRRAELERDWQTAGRIFEAGEIFVGTASNYNKGGLIVCLGRVRGFVPASQLDASRRTQRGETQLGEEHWASLIGQQLQLKIIELDRQRNRLILSEKAAMSQWRREQKAKLLNELREGETRRGQVSSLCDFGAFIDLGGTEGLIHLSELSWGRVKHPREMLQVGDEVDVYVLSVDRERRRIGLSLKRLHREPWSLVDEKYTVGQLVKGTVTKLTGFGAFAMIDDEIEGLIHVSELTDQPVGHPREVVKEGDVLTLRIVRIDSSRHRMGLSLKQVNEDEQVVLDWEPETEDLPSEADEGLESLKGTER